MPEHDALVLSYSHLAQLPRANEALHALKKVASLVKPIMRARGWKVKELAEFYPDQQNLLGLNVNKGFKICLRLRYPGDRNQFMPIEQVTDTMLHELCHNVIGPHNQQFHALWDQLRDEHQGLLMKGYTGEGFLSEGRRLGGSHARIPPGEARRIALQAAEKRKAAPAGTGGGQRLGGLGPRPGDDIRRVIADAVQRRNNTMKGCGTEKLDEHEIRDISDAATRNGFKTQAEEDEANEVAIAQALWELVQEDERAKHKTPYMPPPPVPQNGTNSLLRSGESSGPPLLPTTDRAARDASSTVWVCGTCTLHNPSGFLCCDACGAERSGIPAPGTPSRNASQPAASELTSTPPASRSRLVGQYSKTQGKKRVQSEVVDLTSSPERKNRGTIPSTTAAVKPAESTPEIWLCSFCGEVMMREWWTCSTCGRMKDSS